MEIRHKKCYSLLEIFEKVYFIVKFKKTEFHEFATNEVSAFSITPIYLIQFIMNKNCRNSC